MNVKLKKKTGIQLTSLLDLLFLMVFLSLLQTQVPSGPTQQKVEEVLAETAPTKRLTSPEPAKAPRSPNEELRAQFEFRSGTTYGQFLMRGKFDPQKNSMKLVGIQWVERPPQYDMVPLEGTFNSDFRSFSGQIDSANCSQVQLQKKEGPSGGPQGVWVGSYTCLQGSTDLALTIE